MTATIHPHPRARDRQAGAGYPAAFGSAAGPGFHWGAPAAPARAASPVPLAARLARTEEGPARPALRAAS